jgi:hypothetical protein
MSWGTKYRKLIKKRYRFIKDLDIFGMLKARSKSHGKNKQGCMAKRVGCRSELNSGATQ